MFPCVNALAAHLSDVFSAPPDFDVELDPCPPEAAGDFTVNGFKLAKALKARPDAVAESAAAFLAAHPDVRSCGRVKAFVNFSLADGPLMAGTLKDVPRLLASAALPPPLRRKVLVEYSAPNTNKPLHLGHVRNNTLGMSLVSLLRRVGHDVAAVNLVNDRGVHICKSMIAYQRFGAGATPLSTGVKGDHLVGDFYVKFDQELRRQLAELRRSRPGLAAESDEKLFTETEIGAATQRMLQDWERGDPGVRSLWRMMNDWVLAGFEQTYARMGVRFDKVYFESDTYELGRGVVLDGLARGVFARRADGAVVADLSADKLGEKVLLRSDGTSVYITQDIGTTLRKHEDFGADAMVWVVGDEQIHHFKTLFAILRKLGLPWAEGCHHMAYGMVNLPSGRMKSREGTVVDADDLFDEMRRLAREATLSRCEGAEPPADLDARAEAIGMGALKFMLLKFNAKTTMTFDPEASIAFEGDTGPYVQYAKARVNSILRKAEERFGPSDLGAADWSLLSSEPERKLAVSAAFYPQALRLAAERMDCSGLAAHLLDFSKAFNAFYRECPALNAPDGRLRLARLAMASAAGAVLADGLDTLTIPSPEAM